VNDAPLYRIDRSKAEQILAEHLAPPSGQSRSSQKRRRGAVRRFLADLGPATEEPSSRQLILSQARLFNWLVGEARRHSTVKAIKLFRAVSSYVRALTRAGLLETDLMAHFRARSGKRGWKVLIAALQADEPVAALTLLRIEQRAGPLALHAQRYLELHQGIGKNYRPNKRVLEHLDHFLEAQQILSTQAITPQVIERWAATTTGNARTRMLKGRMVWHFFNHLLDLKVMSCNPVSAVLFSLDRRPGTLFKPFIYTKEQVAAILEAARQLPGGWHFPLRAQTCATILTLLYALGLRIGEACRLRVRDLSIADATLFIDRTKFYKSRYVPFGPQLGLRLQQFLNLRRSRELSLGEDDPLFVAQGPAHVNQSAVRSSFREILEGLGIRGAAGQNAPRLHDLRHSFAVNRLLRWYREGADVQSKLSALSTFLGHLDPKSTQVYLTITAALLQEANTRFYRNFGYLFDQENQR
jgi:integrase